ncbi:MAG: radical SAM protein [Desulfovibrionaceae bacterium]|nr:radical SAM protein [Desulfovibrionaceae bacterium]
MGSTRGLYFGRTSPPPVEHGGRLPVALAIPGDKGPALSTLGWQAVYRLLAAEAELSVERFFLGRGHDVPLSEEGKASLSSFPVLALSVSFEEDVLRLLRALKAAGIPRLRSERPDPPLLVAGGPLCFLNPAPLAPFCDLIWVGEAEAGFADLLRELKGHLFSGGDPQDFLAAVADRPGVYVPGRTRAATPRVVAGDGGPLLAEPAFSCFTGPEAVFKDALLLEVNRGCPYGCRFCAAGYIYRPPRHAALADLQAIVEDIRPPKVGLVGTALTDWPDLLPFLRWLDERKVKFSLSSLRADGLTEELLTFLRACGVRTVTLALEAPSRRLRLAASKKLEEADFLRAVELCARHGVNHLRVYCIIGWPGENEADYEEFSGFLGEIATARERGQVRKKEFLRLTLGVSCLVPKPWTPFQWAPMASEEYLDDALRRIKAMLKPYKGFSLSGDDAFLARVQGLISRGGEDVAELLLLAADHGGWKKGLALWGGDMSAVLDHERGKDEAFPWEVVDLGVRREHLRREWERSKQAKPSPGCPPAGCEACGVCGLGRRRNGT